MQFVKCPILTNNSYPIGIFVGNILLRAARKELRNSLITSLIHFGSTLLNHLLRFYNIDPPDGSSEEKDNSIYCSISSEREKAIHIFRHKSFPPKVSGDKKTEWLARLLDHIMDHYRRYFPENKNWLSN